MSKALVKIIQTFGDHPVHAIAKVVLYTDLSNRILEKENELKTIFLPDGEIFWPTLSSEFLKDDFAWVELEEANNFDEYNPLHKKYRVKYSSRGVCGAKANEFIYAGLAGKIENESDFRNAFCIDGLDSFKGNTVTIYYYAPSELCDDMGFPRDSWIGPIKLERDNTEERYRLREDQKILEVRIFEANKIKRVEVGTESKHFTMQYENKSEIYGYINIQSDEEIIADMKGMLRGLDYLNATRVDPKTIEILQKRFEAAAGILSADAKKYKAYVRRVKDLVNRIDELQQRKNDVKNLAEACIELPDIQKEISLFKETYKKEAILEFEERKKKQNEEIKISKDKENRRVEDFEKEIEILAKKITEENIELENIKSLQNSEIHSFSMQIQKLLNEHAPTIDILKKAFPLKTNNCYDIVEEQGAYFEEPMHTEERIISFKEIMAALEDNSVAYKIDCEILQVSLLLLLSGKIPIFTGVHAIKAAKALTNVISGRNTCWVSVSSSVFSSYDLFGKVKDNGKFIEAPHKLLSFLLYAFEHKDVQFCVVLEGLNRSPLEVYMPLLIDEYSSSNKEGEDRNQNVITKDNIFVSNRLFWPQNVFLMGTYVDGKTVYRINESMLGEISLVSSQENYEDNKCGNPQICSCNNLLRPRKSHMYEDMESIRHILSINVPFEEITNITSEYLKMDDEAWQISLKDISLLFSSFKNIEYNRARIYRTD